MITTLRLLSNAMRCLSNAARDAAHALENNRSWTL